MVDYEIVNRLRELGATRITFYSDGKLQCVDFASPFAEDGKQADDIPDFVTPKAFTELMKGADGP